MSKVIKSKHDYGNFVQSFAFEKSLIRGRIVRCGHVLNEILTAHNYPLPVMHLVAESIILTCALSSMLKYEGIFTLQAQGDGLVKMLVSDMTSAGVIRGCASFDEKQLESACAALSELNPQDTAEYDLAQYLGQGHLAFTVDQGKHTERYQGIVALKGGALIDSVRHYFTQSEQIGTGIKMAIGQRDGLWRGSAIMLQHMPEDQVNNLAGKHSIGEDDWRRAMVLLESCTDDELLSDDISAQELLFRLFHEEGVNIYPEKPLVKGCRCDEQRVHNVLLSMPEEDIDHIAVDGMIAMTCEFCSHAYVFARDRIKHKG